MFAALLRFLKLGVVSVGTVVVFAYALVATQDMSIPERQENPLEVSKPTIIAFSGDHGTKPASRQVFELMVREDADILVSQGDLGYDSSPEEFESFIDGILGPDFPVVAALGNRDWVDREAYRLMLGRRLLRTPEVECDGAPGLESTCRFRGIEIVSVTPGLPRLRLPWSQGRYLDSALRKSRSRWKICSWHMTQAVMQLGKKWNGTGWRPYENCRRHGALIVTAHEHSYGRTWPLSDISDPPEVAETSKGVQRLQPGQTVVIVNGIGGHSIRKQEHYKPWWAAAYTRTQNALAGALFCSFDPGHPNTAACRLVNIAGETVDEFTLQNGFPAEIHSGDVDVAETEF